MTTNLTPPLWRQHVLRVLFLLILVGLGPDHWAEVFVPTNVPSPMSGVTISFYAAFSFLCLLGIRHPLKFIPLLLIQLVYKSAWIIGTYLPAKSTGLLDDNYESWFWSMAPGIVIDLVVIPWGYVYREYLKDFFVWKKVTA